MHSDHIDGAGDMEHDGGASPSSPVGPSSPTLQEAPAPHSKPAAMKISKKELEKIKVRALPVPPAAHEIVFGPAL